MKRQREINKSGVAESKVGTERRTAQTEGWPFFI